MEIHISKQENEISIFKLIHKTRLFNAFYLIHLTVVLSPILNLNTTLLCQYNTLGEFGTYCDGSCF